MTEPRLDHVGLSVGDLAAMADWYTGVLGFRRELTLRVEPIDLDIVMLILPGGGRLELLHRPGSARLSALPDPGAAALQRGYGHPPGRPGRRHRRGR